MNCNQIKEFLKTDYCDGELGEAQLMQVKEHIDQCPSCRELKEIIESTAQPFRSASEMQPPDSVWQNIKESIEEEQEGVMGWLSSRLFKPTVIAKPAYALASVVFVLLITLSIFLRMPSNGEMARVEESKDISALEYLSGEDVAYANGDANGFGTAIEEFLL